MHTNGRLGRKVCATPESVQVPCANQACAQRGHHSRLPESERIQHAFCACADRSGGCHAASPQKTAKVDHATDPQSYCRSKEYIRREVALSHAKVTTAEGCWGLARAAGGW